MTRCVDINDTAQGALITATNARSFYGEWRDFSDRYSGRISEQEAFSYSLPSQLLKSITSAMPNWLTANAVTFEEAFADL